MKAEEMSGVGGVQAHASADELALFILDALDPPARRHLERHVAECAACARALSAEAAAEVALTAAWSEVPRPLAPVLSLPVRPAAVVPVPAPARAVPRPVAAPALRRSSARHHALAGNSWSNGLAAAVLTVLFVGYWNDGGRMTTMMGASGRSRAAGELGEAAQCTRELFTPAPLLLASMAPEPRGARMCTVADPGETPGGLCQEPAAACGE
jgi:hypothetical protein